MARRRPDGSFAHTEYPTPVEIDGLRIDLSEAELEANKRGWITPEVNEKLLQIASQALSQALTAKDMADIETLALLAAHKAARRAYPLRHIETRPRSKVVEPPGVVVGKVKAQRASWAKGGRTSKRTTKHDRGLVKRLHDELLKSRDEFPSEEAFHAEISLRYEKKQAMRQAAQPSTGFYQIAELVGMTRPVG